MKDCASCALKKPKKKKPVEKVFGWAVKVVLVLIVMLAAWEQFLNSNQ